MVTMYHNNIYIVAMSNYPYTKKVIQMTNYNENIYWHERTYGSALRIKRFTLRSVIIALGIIVPVVLPIPVMVFISRFVKNDVILRYEKKEV